MSTKRFTHDCLSCVYLGHYEDHDLYYCPQGSLPTVIARFGNEGPEYASGIPGISETTLQEQLKRLKEHDSSYGEHPVDPKRYSGCALRVAFMIARDLGFNTGGPGHETTMVRLTKWDRDTIHTWYEVWFWRQQAVVEARYTHLRDRLVKGADDE